MYWCWARVAFIFKKYSASEYSDGSSIRFE